jgi:hypothetical protein
MGLSVKMSGSLLGLFLSLPVLRSTLLTLPTTEVLFGKRVLLFTGHEAAHSLGLADALLRAGASVELVVPLPQAGAAVRDDGALRLLQRIQRAGFQQLMEELDYVRCDPRRSVGSGNRPRVTWSHMQADDVEDLALKLTDSDIVLVHPAQETLEDAMEERARFIMRRRVLVLLLHALRQRGQQLQRDRGMPWVRWARL